MPDDMYGPLAMAGLVGWWAMENVVLPAVQEVSVPMLLVVAFVVYAAGFANRDDDTATADGDE